MINSVAKGYECLQLIISYMPLAVRAFINLVFGAIALSALWSVLKKWLFGGD